MDDWKIGDLAICVLGGPIDGYVWPRAQYPRVGQVIRVEDVRIEHPQQTPTGDVFLYSRELPPNVDGTRGWGAIRFRKIEPHTPDEEDIETIRLLTGEEETV